MDIGGEGGASEGRDEGGEMQQQGEDKKLTEYIAAFEAEQQKEMEQQEEEEEQKEEQQATTSAAAGGNTHDDTNEGGNTEPVSEVRHLETETKGKEEGEEPGTASASTAAPARTDEDAANQQGASGFAEGIERQLVAEKDVEALLLLEVDNSTQALRDAMLESFDTMRFRLARLNAETMKKERERHASERAQQVAAASRLSTELSKKKKRNLHLYRCVDRCCAYLHERRSSVSAVKLLFGCFRSWRESSRRATRANKLELRANAMYVRGLLRRAYNSWRDFLIESLQENIESKVILRMAKRERQLEEHYNEIIAGLHAKLEATRFVPNTHTDIRIFCY